MFIHVIPMVLFMAVFAVALFTLNIPTIWKISWWLSGISSAWVIFNFKGEDFSGGIEKVVNIGVLGILGYFLVPLAIIFLVLDYRLCFNIEEEWEKEAENRDRKIAKKWSR